MAVKYRLDIAAFSCVLAAALLLCQVACQCSEAHRQACSRPYLQMQALYAQPALGRYVPDLNQTTLQTVCRSYQDYRNCTEPFLTSCNNRTREEIQTFDVSLGLICTDLFNDYLQHRACFHRLQGSHVACRNKQVAAIKDIDVRLPAYKLLFCSAARDYVLCVYTATALGCSMSAADTYFRLLNSSISHVFRTYSYPCSVRHPMDVISIFTSTRPTTGAETVKAFTSSDSPIHSKEVSAASSVTPPDVYMCYFLSMMFLWTLFNKEDIISKINIL
ncbi:uncharacterized protein LOC128232634 [Mya arenaria]|uniref:uncharacterized protein LOC128232634 n=1 Tax=Mya arenaria TaxID=6604 RepID=UPI0022E1D01A|nr:uncharacterized protein LOC128232634 [Mya arenaria]